MLESRAEAAANYLPTARVLSRVVSHSPPTPHVSTHLTSTRFPRKRDTPMAQSLPNTPSTWSLVSAAGGTDPRPDSPKRSELDEGVSGLRDPSDGGPRVGGPEPQANPEPPMPGPPAQGQKPPPQMEDKPDKPSRFKRVKKRLKKFMKSKLISTL